MPNPISRWTEDDVLALPAGEDNSFERKGAKLLDLKLAGVSEDGVLNELAKQLSAFANAAGGQIIYGVANDGTVDNGGIAQSVKGRQSTREWLEDVIPKLTEFEIIGFNVYEIGPKTGNSSITAGKAIFVVDVPASDRAPHQSKRDQKYYVRLGGKSQPAPHQMIEDIRNRQKHPVVELPSIGVDSIQLPGVLREDRVPVISGTARIQFRFTIKNVGRVMARYTCLRLEAEKFDWIGCDNTILRSKGDGHVFGFWEFRDPVYPGMEVNFWIQGAGPIRYGTVFDNAPAGGPWFVADRKLADMELQFRIFADNAPAKEGVITMEKLEFERAAGAAVDQHPLAGTIRLVYRTMAR